MKKIAIYGLLLFSGLQFVACSDDEDRPTPSNYNDDFFGVPADATGPEAELRRDFHKETGIHLLFTDTLRTTLIGKDPQGKDIYEYETIDFAWNLTNYNTSYDWEPKYIESIDDKRKATDLFREYIMPHIAGSSMAPYSVLLLADLRAYNNNTFRVEDAYTTSCWRSIGVNTSGWITAETDEDINAHTAGILKDLVSARFDSRSDEAAPWFEISDEYYGADIVDYNEDWDGEDLEYIYSLGFLDFNDHWSGRPNRDYFLYESSDFTMFFNAIFERTEDDFKAEFGAYPVIMEKYNLMKSLIEQTGYKF